MGPRRIEKEVERERSPKTENKPDKKVSPIKFTEPEKLNRRLDRFRRFNENAAPEGLIQHLRILLLKLNEKQVLSSQTRKRTMGQLRKLLSHPSKSQRPVLLPVRSRKLF